MKVAFLGTPDFAIPSLNMLVSRYGGGSIAVFTQPDRPKGRRGELAPPPVKLLAQEKGIPVFQFERIRSPEGVAALKAFAPDVMVTAAFGQLLSQENLDVPPHGCINVHGSLLPKYRGAAPIQWAVINGETRTGITTMQTDIGLDTGDILLKRETPIGPNETAGELFGRLSVMGADVLAETLQLLERGKLERTPQDEASATKCSIIRKEHARVDFSLPSNAIHNLVRGMNPWPVAFAELEGEQVKLYSTRVLAEGIAGKPGECVVADPKEGLLVCTGAGAIEILELQFAGGKRMSAKAALMGRKLLGKQFK